VPDLSGSNDPFRNQSRRRSTLGSMKRSSIYEAWLAHRGRKPAANGTRPVSDEKIGASFIVTSTPAAQSFQATPFSDQAPEGGNRLFT
jgi:hypothetical protein